MLAGLAAVALAAAPATAPVELIAPLLLEAAKKKKGKEKPKEKAPPAETSEGLDLSQPDPAPAAAPAPDPAPVAEEAAPETKPSEAPAAWSLVTPFTVGESANVIEAGVGWPGIYASYWRGLLPELDVGAKVGFNWSLEGLATRPLPGLRIQAQARYKIWDNGSLSLGVSFSPGAVVYFFPFGVTRGGLLLPVAATVGLPNFVKKLNLSATLEIPFFVLFGFGAVVPFVAGVNAEYPLTDSLMAFAKLRPLGIGIWTNGGGVSYLFEATVGVGYHL